MKGNEKRLAFLLTVRGPAKRASTAQKQKQIQENVVKSKERKRWEAACSKMKDVHKGVCCHQLP